MNREGVNGGRTVSIKQGGLGTEKGRATIENGCFGIRKGSSTVLVILMIVLLVSLSVLSVSVSNSGYKLSKRMGEQFKGYYLLESEADRCYSALCLMGKEQITTDVMKNLGCLDGVVDDNICSFRVEKDNRSFCVSFRLDDKALLSWYEKERVFKEKPLEYSNFD